MKREFHCALVLLALLATGCQSGLPVIQRPTFAARTVSILDFGAVGDGKTLNTAAFAKAIDACASAGGGRVVVPAGTYFTGPIHLLSGIDFHLDAGAIVLFSRNFDDYPLVIANFEGRQSVVCTSPLSGEGLHDVAITGPGIINGQGEAWRPTKKSKLTDAQWTALVKSGGFVEKATDTWWPSLASKDGQIGLRELRQSTKPLRVEDYEKYRDLLRPALILFSNCHNVLLEGPTFRDSPSWNVHLLYSDDITVHRVNIFNELYAQNGDGLDIDSCRDVNVSDSSVIAGDDVICLKSGRDAEGRRAARPTENVTITRCALGHGHGGIAIGSEMSGDVRNVFVSHCVFNATDNAIRFKSVRGRGGVVENIHISDVQMSDVVNACVSFDMYYQVMRPTTLPSTTRPTSRPGFRPGFRRRFVTATMPATMPDQVAKVLEVKQEPPMPIDEGTPRFRDITIRNLTCTSANIAMILRGLPEAPLENMTIENAEIIAKQGGAILDAHCITLRDVHIKSASVPDFQIQNVTNLVMENVDAVPQQLK